MMYLFVQTWLFLGIAWMVGIVIGFLLARDQKAQRHKEVEAELLDSRDRAIMRDKEIDEYRLRVAELEGLPDGARASRVAARDEMIARMTHLERELDSAKTNEKKLNDEAERLRGEVDGFRTRYLEARAKWDEYQTKAEALAAAPPQPAALDLGSATMMPDDTMRERVMELEGQLGETMRVRDKAMEQIKTLTGRVRELEAQPAAMATGGDSKVLQARIAELEGRLASGFSSARETDALKSRVADLQDKLSEAEVALSKAVSSTKAAGAEPLKARISELEAQLTEARSKPSVVELGSPQSDGESARLRARLGELEGKLADAQRQAGEAQNLRSRLADLEQALDKAKRQANEAQTQRAQIASLEARLAAHTDDRATGSEDVSLLKARLADVEARLMSGSQSSVEFDSLRNRVMTLEALLHEAAKSRDEAAILRSKVAELDGRLGQALKAAAEIREKA
jgi:chromosome segregation ATPase